MGRHQHLVVGALTTSVCKEVWNISNNDDGISILQVIKLQYLIGDIPSSNQSDQHVGGRHEKWVSVVQEVGVSNGMWGSGIGSGLLGGTSNGVVR
jgi:hypothetical protein